MPTSSDRQFVVGITFIRSVPVALHLVSQPHLLASILIAFRESDWGSELGPRDYIEVLKGRLFLSECFHSKLAFHLEQYGVSPGLTLLKLRVVCIVSLMLRGSLLFSGPEVRITMIAQKKIEHPDLDARSHKGTTNFIQCNMSSYSNHSDKCNGIDKWQGEDL